MEHQKEIVGKCLLDWLRDAHAMEMQAEIILKGQISRLVHYPELKRRLELHLEETQEQAKIVARCIERRGGSTSALKDVGGKAAAAMQNMSGFFASDEVLKGGLFSYAFEHLEIASYSSLIVAARYVGDEETASACATILEQERAMAAWLEERLDGLTLEYLERSVSDKDAKR